MFKFLRRLFSNNRTTYHVDTQIAHRLDQLARVEQVSEEERLEALARFKQPRRIEDDPRWSDWVSFTELQQDILAFTCLGCTNSQIAMIVQFSRETVKYHLAHIRKRLGVHSKDELRALFDDWDFSDWLERIPQNLRRRNQGGASGR